MSFWKTLAKFAPLAAFAIPGVGPAVGGAIAGISGKAAGKFFNSPGGAAVTGVAGDLIGAGLQHRSQNKASNLASLYNTQALDYLKEQDARDFAEYLKERDRGWRYQDEDRAHMYKREGEREGRLTPFRQGAERGYQTLSSLLFNPQQPLQQSMPVGRTRRASLADLVRS